MGLPKDGIVHVVLPEAERERGLRIKPLNIRFLLSPDLVFRSG